MLRVGFVAMVAFLAILAGGCAEATVEPVQVKGKVLLDGQPMASGKIAFAPVGEPPRVLDVANGAYTGLALPGKNRVEISAFKKGTPPPSMPDMPAPDVNYLPARYNASSELTADVQATGENNFDFSVQSK